MNPRYTMKRTPLGISALGTAVICSVGIIVLYLFYFHFYVTEGVLIPLFALFFFFYIIVGSLKYLLAGERIDGFRPELLLIGTSLAYTSGMALFLEGRLQPVGSLNKYLRSISLALFLLSAGVLAVALFYRYSIDRHKKAKIMKKDFMEPEEFKTETYYKQMRIELWIPSIVVGVCILFILTQKITPPELGISLLVLFCIGGFLAFFHRRRAQKKVQIILKSDSFIQTGKLSKAIPWKSVDRVVLSRGIFRKELCIYFRENNQIKKFYPPYSAVDNREKFLRSLRRFSKIYGFDFKEKMK